MEKVIRNFTKFRNEGLHDLHALIDIIWWLNGRGQGRRQIHKGFVGKHEGKSSLGKKCVDGNVAERG